MEKVIYNFLKKWKDRKFVLGFSGGNDSSCLLYILKKLKFNIIPVFVCTELTKNSIKLAKKMANILELSLEIINLQVLNHNEIRNNTELRCYYCKKLMYQEIKKNFKSSIILDGTNYSDTFSYRPGIKALEELAIISPFKECKIEKKLIMDYLKENFQELISEPQSCIATKYPYNTDLTKFLE